MVETVRMLVKLLPVLLLLCSCNKFDTIEIRGVDRVIFQGMENSTVYFSAGLKVYNPSGVSFRIREVNLKTVANGDFLGTLECTDHVKIEARSDSVYMIPLSLKLANIFTGASSLYKLSRQHSIKLEVKGYVRARSMLISKKVEVCETQVIDVPKIR